MGRHIFSEKTIKLINGFFCISIFAVVISIFISEGIAQHRMQAISFLMGLVLALWGIDIIIKKDFTYPIKVSRYDTLLKERFIIKKGKRAVAIGFVIFVTGVLLVIWGLFFWIDFFKNI